MPDGLKYNFLTNEKKPEKTGNGIKCIEISVTKQFFLYIIH